MRGRPGILAVGREFLAEWRGIWRYEMVLIWIQGFNNRNRDCAGMGCGECEPWTAACSLSSDTSQIAVANKTHRNCGNPCARTTFRWPEDGMK